MANEEWARLHGQTVFDNTGQKVGDVQRVFFDRETGDPSWVTIRGGRFGTREAFVPATGSKIGPGGLALAVREDAIIQSPAVDAGRELSMGDATELSGYYQSVLDGTPNQRGTEMRRQPERRQPDLRQDETPQPEMADISQPVELTSYEEQLRVGAQAVESGAVRLHKSVVTENVETSVPLRHEEVRVERIPAEARPTADHDFADEDIELILHEERAMVAKETVPVETVRIAAESRTEQEQVSDAVRRERIEVDTGEQRR
jgi:uncharacterized protein (TIGR02271 family)